MIRSTSLNLSTPSNGGRAVFDSAGPDPITASFETQTDGNKLPVACQVSVLVVEDDPAISTLLAEALEAAGCRVTVARDGFAALNFVRSVTPDAVVLDLGLPVLDGQEFLDAWRTAAPTQSVPVLVLSASAQLPPLLASVGVLGHFTKPFDIDEVVAAVVGLASGGALATEGRSCMPPRMTATAPVETRLTAGRGGGVRARDPHAVMARSMRSKGVCE